jgi:hypothetical protein
VTAASVVAVWRKVTLVSVAEAPFRVSLTKTLAMPTPPLTPLTGTGPTSLTASISAVSALTVLLAGLGSSVVEPAVPETVTALVVAGV